MKPDDMTSVADSYDAVAELYTGLVKDNLDIDMHRLPVDEFVALVNALSSDDGVVLDAGCGPGHVAAYMAKAGLNVVGVDLSPGLLEQAAIHFPDVATEIGDLMAL
jgi:ubiquinone/menaquinone biosynthesis C-methylase UbiE